MIMGKTIAQVQIGKVVPLRQQVGSMNLVEGGGWREEGE
jgi:hypothetical protein